MGDKTTKRFRATDAPRRYSTFAMSSSPCEVLSCILGHDGHSFPLSGLSVKYGLITGGEVRGVYKDSMRSPPWLCASQSHFHIIYSESLCFVFHNCQGIEYL